MNWRKVFDIIFVLFFIYFIAVTGTYVFNVKYCNEFIAKTWLPYLEYYTKVNYTNLTLENISIFNASG